MATGLAESQIVPLNLAVMIMVERAGIVVSLSEYRAFVSMWANVICFEAASFNLHA